MRERMNSERGFTMIEVMITMVVMAVMIAATVIEMQPMIQQVRANEAANMVLGQLRSARQISIATRRDIQVQFIGNNEIRLTQQPVPGVAGTTVVISDIFLNPTVTFMQFAGEPDTPDGFGNGAPIYFGGAVGGPPFMEFQSNGTFINGGGTPVSGTVFIGVANVPASARAVTVLGTTGRVRLYKGTGTGWIQ